MPTIELAVEIRAPIERVFDLSRSIDLHVETTSRTMPVFAADAVAFADRRVSRWVVQRFEERLPLAEPAQRIKKFTRQASVSSLR